MIDQDYCFTVKLIGNCSVGKTSIFVRFSEKAFYDPMIRMGANDYYIKKIQSGSNIIKFILWDTAGQQRFGAIKQNYYKGNGVILVYDITSRESFTDIQHWLGEVNKYGSPNLVKILIGNKVDMEEGRKVKTQQGKVLAESLGITFLETSAKSDILIEELFVIISNQMIQKVNQKIEKQKK